MPKVDGKHYAYTKAGKAAASRARKKKKKKRKKTSKKKKPSKKGASLTLIIGVQMITYAELVDLLNKKSFRTKNTKRKVMRNKKKHAQRKKFPPSV